MNLNQVFELSTVLDNEHFQKVFARSYHGEVNHSQVSRHKFAQKS